MIARVAFLLWLAGAAAAAEPARPLPSLPAGPIELRVVHVVNPRFARFDADQLAIMLAETRRVVRAHFGVEVVFTPVETVEIASVFARFGPRLSQFLDRQLYDFRGGTGDRASLVASMRQELTKDARRTSLADLVAFASPYLTAPPRSNDLPGLAQAVIDTHLARLDTLANARALDGGPVIDARPYNEWFYWDTLGYTPLPWDVIITNQLVASAEYGELQIHSSLRGGITAGSTGQSGDGRMGAMAWISTFPFASDLPEIVLLRGGETYDPTTAARLAGAYLTHEIGHLLFHYAHPFGNAACVMTPARLLQFQAWLDGLDPTRCRPNDSPAMRPGAVRMMIDPARQKLAAE
ncbi:MAG: hypothetical protein JO021_08095 [Alphaproteobacteria bacterium]|nr:hypothetical protein [Alphaproteobacteria bacterium]